MEKKTAFLIFEFPPFSGGAGVWLETILQNLDSNLKKQTLLFLPMKFKYLGEEFSGIEIKYFHKIYKFFTLSAYKTIKKEITSLKKIVLCDELALQTGIYTFPKALRKITISVLHGSEVDHLHNLSFLKNLTKYKNKFYHFINGIDSTIFVSNYLRDKFKDELGFLPNHSVIQNSINIENFMNKDYDDSCRKKLGIENTTTVLLTVSRMVKSKGFDKMLSIVNGLVQTGKDIHWIICGEGEYKENLISLIKKNELEDFVSILGYLNKDQLSEVYYAADLFFLLTEFRESFGLVFVEAAATGLYSVSYDAYGMKESVQKGISGELFSIDEYTSIQNFISQYDRKTINKNKCLEFASSFDIKNRIKEYEKVFYENTPH